MPPNQRDGATHPLLFAWKPAGGRIQIVWAAALAAVLAHASFFYLFQTGPGAPSGQIPPAHRITLIDSEVPTGIGLLRALDDYAAVYESSIQSERIDLEAVVTPAGALAFEPTEPRRGLRLLPYDEPADPPVLQPPHAEREPVLPPPPPGASEQAVPPAAQPQFPQIRVTGELAGREIVSRPSRERPSDPLELNPAAVFHAAVDRAGRVLFAFPSEGASSDFASDVQSIRFARDPDAPEMIWGWIRLSW